MEEKEIFAAIWLPASTEKELLGRTIMCFCSHEPFSAHEISNKFGVMDMSMSVTYNQNRLTTVSLIASREEKACFDQMLALRNSLPFRKALEMLVSSHYLNPSARLDFRISLESSDSMARNGLCLVGTVSSSETMVGT